MFFFKFTLVWKTTGTDGSQEAMDRTRDSEDSRANDREQPRIGWNSTVDACIFFYCDLNKGVLTISQLVVLISH